MKHNGRRMQPAAGWFLAAMRGAFDQPEPRKSTERTEDRATAATATLAEIVLAKQRRAASAMLALDELWRIQ